MTDAQNSPTEPNDGKEPVHGREWIAELLERAEFVEWDRSTVMNLDDGRQYVDVYGWIDREDEYKDFVWTRFYPDVEPEGEFEFTTSSDGYSEELIRIWFGEEELENHSECRRVEHAFDVENAIELSEQATLVTDGGVDRDDAGVQYEPPTRWPYRIEGVVLGIPLSYIAAIAFGPHVLLKLNVVGLLLIVIMQYGGVTR